MKTMLLNVLITLGFILGASQAQAQCEITVSKKKEGAKTSYVNGISVSGKILDALSSQCKVSTKVLSKAEIKAMNIIALKKRLAKLEETK